MPNVNVAVSFADNWTWLVFIAVGLLFVILELILGVNTGLDLVFIGSAFVLGGLITVAIRSWVWTAIISGIICLAYVFLGRRFIHRRISLQTTKTNIDTIVGKTGIVRHELAPSKDGLVKVGYEEWRARSEESIKEGEEITVTGVQGVTLLVKKTKGGNN